MKSLAQGFKLIDDLLNLVNRLYHYYDGDLEKIHAFIAPLVDIHYETLCEAKQKNKNLSHE